MLPIHQLRCGGPTSHQSMFLGTAEERVEGGTRTNRTANTTNFNSDRDSIILQRLKFVLLQFEVEVLLGVGDGVSYKRVNKLLNVSPLLEEARVVGGGGSFPDKPGVIFQGGSRTSSVSDGRHC